MISQLLKKKQILQNTPLFDSGYFARAHCDGELNDSVSTEIRYLNEKKLWLEGTSALFNGQYYAYGSEDIRDLSYPPLIHYITNGYFEARRPSALVDIDYIVSQILGEALPEGLYESHQIKVEVLGRYEGIHDLLKTSKVNPNLLFDNEYFVNENGLEDLDLDIPIQYFYSHNARHPDTHRSLECTPMFNLARYLELNEDIVGAKINPLEHLITYGLKERRLRCFDNLFSDEFLENTAELYGNDSYKEHEYFLAKAMRSHQLAGPNWKSRYKKQQHPALQINKDRIAASSVMVGTVLYDNSVEELSRLKASINKEKECCGEVVINDFYFVNDVENMDRYIAIFGEEKVIESPEGNVGFGSGHNYLMNKAFTDPDIDSNYYFGLNPDGYLIRNCIQSMVSFSKHHDDTSLVEANTLPVGHPKWHDPVLFDTKWVSGVAFFLPKGIWADVGGFDEEIHMYCEDVDFSWRVKAAGYSLKICPVASFYHDVTGRFTSEENEAADRKRRKAMLLGAYHLSVKWQATKEAEKYMQMLVGENLLLPNQTIPKPTGNIPVSIAAGVADFQHGLRFSASRYW